VTAAYELTDLDMLESEAVHIIREVAATIEKPGMLFSGGKDSVVMLHLAVKAFWPAPVPFPVMHVDTGQNFDEVLEFRDHTVERYGLRLIVAKVQDDIDAGRVVEEGGPLGPRNKLQTVTLLRGIRENRFGAVFGGARRDEEKARAKERVFSFRDEFGAWDPRNQRPELWNLYNGLHRKGENIRVFPLSNWTELDIWNYIRNEEIDLPQLYYAHTREVVERDGMLLAVNRFIEPTGDEKAFEAKVRFRTMGDATCTGCVESNAETVEDVVAEVAAARISEAGMEDRKKEGYF
jgi:sulfate adenylyltransferase subunit 2